MQVTRNTKYGTVTSLPPEDKEVVKKHLQYKVKSDCYRCYSVDYKNSIFDAELNTQKERKEKRGRKEEEKERERERKGKKSDLASSWQWPTFARQFSLKNSNNGIFFPLTSLESLIGASNYQRTRLTGLDFA